MIQNTHSQDDFLIQVIKRGIQSETQRLISEAIENIKKEMERRTPEIIAGITVDIMSRADMQIMQDRIVFTITRKP